ncbi:MAG TPA: hypothetical protein VFF59_06075 [Anaerolineae bacterium]|nr:hypothetical protein [Anaerolineae bacterium]
MKKSRLLIVMLITVLIGASACGRPSTPTPAGPRVVLTPGELLATPVLSGTPLPVNLSQAQGAALRALTAATNLSPDQIRPIVTEPVQWPNSCLGTRQTGIECAQQIVPGFRIVLEAKGRRYEYHTNEDGSTIVLAAEKSPYIRVAVRAADNRVVVLDSPVLFDPQMDVIVGGLLPQAGMAGAVLYALEPGAQSRVIEFDAGETRPLEFVTNPSGGLAVWPGDAGDLPRLSWGTSPTSENSQSSLLVSAPDGADLTELVTEQIGSPPYQLVAQRWSLDGQSIYYSKEPYGLGGYIPFAGASSLYRVTVADRTTQELLAFNPNAGRAACLDDLSSDGRLVAHHCDGALISVRDLGNDFPMKISPPVDAAGFRLAGSARFDPSASRVAYALAVGDPDNEQGWVAVSRDLSGPSQLVLASNRGEYLTVIGWLNADTLLVQSNGVQCKPTCASSVWTVGLDGSGLTKVADGTFLAVVTQ